MATLLEKIDALIARTASDSKEEARTSAFIACKLIRENSIELREPHTTQVAAGKAYTEWAAEAADSAARERSRRQQRRNYARPAAAAHADGSRYYDTADGGRQRSSAQQEREQPKPPKHHGYTAGEWDDAKREAARRRAQAKAPREKTKPPSHPPPAIGVCLCGHEQADHSPDGARVCNRFRQQESWHEPYRCDCPAYLPPIRIKARYSSQCVNHCGKRVEMGVQVFWYRGKGVAHLDCTRKKQP